MEYSLEIKKARIQLKMSQEELARKLGVSFITVNRWENGKTRPSKLAQARLATFLRKKD